MRSSSWSGGSAAWGALTAVLLLALTGCSTRPPEVAPEIAEAWRLQIDQDLARGHLGEFEREVLADYWVTDEEYAQAREPIPGCMAERGFLAELVPTGGMSVAADPAHWGERDLEDPEVDQAHVVAMEECEGGRIWVEMYYWDMRFNPQGWDYWEALVRCAERLGLTEAAGMSTEELNAATLESDEFLAECRVDPWSLAQGLAPAGGFEPEDRVEVEVDL